MSRPGESNPSIQNAHASMLFRIEDAFRRHTAAAAAGRIEWQECVRRLRREYRHHHQVFAGRCHD